MSELVNFERELYRRLIRLIEVLGKSVKAQSSMLEENAKRLERIEGVLDELVKKPSLEGPFQELVRTVMSIEKRVEALEDNIKSKAEEKVSLPKPASGKPFYQDKIYQWKQISAGKRDVVYRYRRGDPYWGSGEVAIIYYLGTNDWFTNTYINWFIDNYLKEKLERQIAPVNSPLRLTPIPLVAKREIMFEAFNGDSSAHKFEILCDGTIMDEDSAKAIGLINT
jgi:hypothetical protein